jgi:glucan biosynthesis protein
VLDVEPSGAATVLDQQVTKNPVTGGWRLVFRLQVDDAARVRAVLRESTNELTERWIEQVSP